MRALIVDDDIDFIWTFLDTITKISRRLKMNLVVDVEHEPLRCLDAHEPYDIYFIDIVMPKLSGIDLVKQLQKKHINKEFVFVSECSDFMRTSMFLKPRGFVRKDHLASDLRETLEVLNQVVKECDAEIIVKDNLRDVPIKPNQVVYMRSEEHYVRIHLVTGENILIRNKLGMLEPTMLEHDFLRIHLRYLINLNYVQDYDKYKQIAMKNGEELPISAPYAKNTDEIITNWMMCREY